MRTFKVAVVLVFMFVLAISAGVVTGRLTSKAPAPTAVGGGSLLSDELQLTAEQREQMRPIWESVRDTARSCAAEAERVEREHEERLKAILTDEQKARYQQLSEADHSRIAALDAKRKEAFRNAVGQTNKLLREDQRRAYQRIISDQVGSLRESGQESMPAGPANPPLP
jgi:Spy/CpxP family protein refolding chaperone